MTGSIRRREFLQLAASATAALAAPTILTAQKTDAPVVIGSGAHRYEVLHNWPQLPDKFTWQTTHNVALDRSGNLYVIHEGDSRKPDHPAIFVFDVDGKFIRSFGQQFQGGGHGLEVREEDGDEFLYVTAYQHLKSFAKLTLSGEEIWKRHAPMESGIYARGEDTQFDGTWGRDRFMPTNIAFHPNGGDFYVADGYGAYVVHRYDKDANYKSTFGREGTSDGQFNLPHGIWIDQRKTGAPKIVVADRVNARLQWFSLDGEHLETLSGFVLPANVDTRNDVMLVPDLKSRLTLLDGDNNVIVHLGGDEAWGERVMKESVRAHPEQWPPGKFIHPHDAAFDADGNIYVAEWVATGRITKLRKVS